MTLVAIGAYSSGWTTHTPRALSPSTRSETCMSPRARRANGVPTQGNRFGDGEKEKEVD